MTEQHERFPAFLKHKLARRVTLATLVFALIAGSVNAWIVFARRTGDANTLQDQLAATVQSSASVAAFANNEEIAKDVIDGLLSHPLVATAGIVGDNDLNIFSRQRPGRFPGESVRYPLHSPMGQREVIGYLYIAIDTAYVRAIARETTVRQTAVIVLQIAISTLLLIVLFDLEVARPLNALARRIRAIVPGSGSRLEMAVGHHDDELGSLVSSSNNLLERLEQTLQEERELLAKVEAMEAHYRRIFETTNVGIMVLGPHGELVNSNPALLTRIIGIRFEGLDEAESTSFVDQIFIEPQAIWALISQAAKSGRSTSADCQLKTEGTAERWAHCIVSVVLGQQGQIELIEGVLYDVTSRRQEEERTRKAADLDPLTGLHNRRGMEVFLDNVLHRAADAGFVLGVLLLDLDGFKAVNDTLGHDAGDQVLKGVATRILSRVRRSSDLVARLGGDEFVVLASHCGEDLQLLEELAADLVALLHEPFALSDGRDAHIGASIGIARFPHNGSSREVVIAAADVAMYMAKKAGKNRFAVAQSKPE